MLVETSLFGTVVNRKLPCPNVADTKLRRSRLWPNWYAHRHSQEASQNQFSSWVKRSKNNPILRFYSGLEKILSNICSVHFTDVDESAHIMMILSSSRDSSQAYVENPQVYFDSSERYKSSVYNFVKAGSYRFQNCPFQNLLHLLHKGILRSRQKSFNNHFRVCSWYPPDVSFPSCWV